MKPKLIALALIATVLAACQQEIRLTILTGGDEHINYYGRTDFSDPQHPKQWAAGAYFSFDFEGDFCVVNISDEYNSNRRANMLEVVIDNLATQNVITKDSITTIAIGNKASSCEAPHAVTAEELASGEVCYLLNGDQSNLVFYQTLGTDEVPSLDASRSIVYLAGQTHCDGTPYASVSGYSNTANVQDDHQNVDGFCSYCGAFIEDGLTAHSSSGLLPK